MQLTRFTDLGLRALMRLAAGHDRDERVTTGLIARQVGASEHHVAKAVARLAELGLIESRRGRTGGLRITEAGRTVSIGHLIRHLEGADEVVDCAGERPCPLSPGCRLRGALRDAQEAFYESLDHHTVERLVRPSPITLLPLRPTDAGPSGAVPSPTE